MQVNVRDHGIQVCRMLKADPDTRGLAAGANEYLTKPFSPLALLRMVESLREAV